MVNNGILIRNVQIDDALGIANVLHSQQVFSAMLMPTPAETASRTRERIQSILPDRDSVYVAVLNNQIVGYGAVRWFNGFILPGVDAYLSELFVMPEFRSQKIGSQLLEALRQDAIVRGATRLWCINLRSRESYQRGYYRKSGWEEKDIAVFFDALK
jgi:ribosomal protein S18 acetylase RimI-like enzyme